MRRFRHIKRADRLVIEALLRKGHKAAEIAEEIGVTQRTIYNEIKRGEYIHHLPDWSEEKRYSADLAEMKYQENLRAKGAGLKIGKDIRLANYIEEKICDDGYSPEAVLGELTATGTWDTFSTKICVTTLYSYIDKGIFYRLTNKNLPVKGARRRPYKKVRVQKRASAGTSIDRRPDIEARDEVGHWEMDTVIGKKDSRKTLLVLTERKSRYEIIRLMPDRTADSVIRELDGLERKYGDNFARIFKSITVDNGVEFADPARMEASCAGTGARTRLYYCHAYSSWERGSNECANRLIRRRLPKGINLDNITADEISCVECWINNYPRGILDFQSASDVFQSEIKIFENKS